MIQFFRNGRWRRRAKRRPDGEMEMERKSLKTNAPRKRRNESAFKLLKTNDSAKSLIHNP
jgi:hypothetical protein